MLTPVDNCKASTEEDADDAPTVAGATKPFNLSPTSLNAGAPPKLNRPLLPLDRLSECNDEMPGWKDAAPVKVAGLGRASDSWTELDKPPYELRRSNVEPTTRRLAPESSTTLNNTSRYENSLRNE